MGGHNQYRAGQPDGESGVWLGEGAYQFGCVGRTRCRRLLEALCDCETSVDNCHVTRYAGPVIKTFADKKTQELYTTGRSRGFPPDVARRARRKLEYVDLATHMDDLKVPPGNRLHQLREDRKGQYAIRINDQWRVCFRFVDGDAYDVEITDYH